MDVPKRVPVHATEAAEEIEREFIVPALLVRYLMKSVIQNFLQFLYL